MLIFLCLGNPGEHYAANRHNAGFFFADFLIDSFRSSGHIAPESDFPFDKYLIAQLCTVSVKNHKIAVLKPQTFMNRSGETATCVRNRFEISASDIIVVHDDLDIPLGKVRLDFAVGPRTHNGIASIESALKTKEFYRLRIGIENRTAPITGENYVLSDFLPHELDQLKASFTRAVALLRQKIPACAELFTDLSL